MLRSVLTTVMYAVAATSAAETSGKSRITTHSFSPNDTELKMPASIPCAMCAI